MRDEIEALCRIAIAHRDGLTNALDADRKNAELRREIIDWNKGLIEGIHPVGETVRLLGELQVRSNASEFLGQYSRCVAAANGEVIGGHIFPKLEELLGAYNEMLADALENFERSDASLRFERIDNAIVELLQVVAGLPFSRQNDANQSSLKGDPTDRKIPDSASSQVDTHTAPFPVHTFRRVDSETLQPIPLISSEVEMIIRDHFRVARSRQLSRSVVDIWDAATYVMLSRLLWEEWLAGWLNWLENRSGITPNLEVPIRLFRYCDAAFKVLAHAGVVETEYENLDESINQIMWRLPPVAFEESPWPNDWERDRSLFAECCNKVRELTAASTTGSSGLM